MKKIKDFFKNIKIKINKSIDNVDQKIEPETGKKIFSIIKSINYIWMLLVLPIIVLSFGATLNTNTSVVYDVEKIETSETQIVKNVEIAAGTSVNLGNVNVDFDVESPVLDSLFNEYKVGNSVSNLSTEITGAFKITDSENKDVILDEVDGNEFSIYSTPIQIGAGIDYSNYEIIAENNTDLTYHINLFTTNEVFMDLTTVNGATLNIANIDESWIESEVAIAIVISIISIWILIWFLILLIKWYFSKWQYYEKIGGEENVN